MSILVLGFLPVSSSLFAQQAATAAATGRGVIATTQQRVDPTMTYHRVLAIVPLVGSGTAADPKRPMFAPAPQSAAPSNPFSVQKGAQVNPQSGQQNASTGGTQAGPSRAGIIGYQHQVSDDGTMALVEFVAADRSAFAALFASTDARVQYFEVGKSTPAQIEAAFKQHKAGFTGASFVPMPVR